MKFTTVAKLPLLAALLALPLAAAGAEQAAAPAAAAPAAAAVPAANAEKPATDKPATDAALADVSKKKPNKDCPISATRIRVKGCDGPEPYRKYSRDDMTNTGEIDMAEALRQLDPIFR